MKPLVSVIRLRALAIFLVFVMLLQPYKVVALAAPNNLTAGSTLTPPRYITSPSGIFAFGFRALDSDPKKFILATWFRSDAGNDSSAQAQPQSVVWFAKQSPSGPTPVATAESVLSITVSGHLALTDGGGKQVLWRVPQMLSLKRGSVLTLWDSGNLQLLGPGDAADGSDVLWQSFWYPTDTLLPGQSLAKDDRSEGKLFSKRADAEFTTGRFSMGVQDDGNIVLYLDLLTGNNPDNAYWQAYTRGNTTITFDDQGRLNYTLGNGTAGSLILPPSSADSTVSDNFMFARMDPDGIVRTYYRPKNGGGGGTSWAMSGSFPKEGCNKWKSGLQGMCGPGSYCVETPERLNCVCPSGYTYTDDQHKDSGCTPQFVPQICGDGRGSESESDHDLALVELPNTIWETSIYYKKFTSVTEEQCRNYCLRDCFCAAALVIGGSDCVEVAVLTNGRQMNGATSKALVKVRTGNSTSSPAAAREESARTRRKILRPYKVITFCLAFLLAISVATAVTCKLCQGYANKAKRRELPGGLRSFTHKELERATNGFEVKSKLGSGGFGVVYKGELSYVQPPHHVVAVKKLKLVGSDADEYSSGRDFQNEVQSVGHIHHKNLVRMIGYCHEGVHRMLVFEYMQGGTLADFIFGQDRPCWSCIAEAAIGIAKGLEYLHEGCKSQIIHCDIKPENILFDDMHTPKITDFGIARLLGEQKTHHSITSKWGIAGTKTYVAPEWFDGRGKVDNKVDVYSFGVMLLEMICCRRAAAWAQSNDQGESTTMRAWVESLVRSGKAELLVGGESEALADMKSVESFARVAIWCLQKEPSARPRMRKVVQMLEGTVEVDPLPDHHQGL